MDNRKIEVLLATIRTGSFSKAASELNCTQSAVTQTVNALESELNCKLLNRTHTGISLSELGEKLLPSILDVDRSIKCLFQQSKMLSEGKTPPIRIGAFSSISNTWLPKLLQSYQGEHPDVSFDIKIGTDIISNWLLNGDIDLALGDVERLHAFRWYPLMQDPYYAVLPLEYKSKFSNQISHEELFSLPFIMAPMNALDKYFTYTPQNEIRVNCDDDFTLLSMVEQGLGVTAMPELSLNHLTHDVSVKNLEPVVSRSLGVALPNNPTKSAVEFTAFLRNSFGTRNGC